MIKIVDQIWDSGYKNAFFPEDLCQYILHIAKCGILAKKFEHILIIKNKKNFLSNLWRSRVYRVVLVKKKTKKKRGKAVQISTGKN